MLQDNEEGWQYKGVGSQRDRERERVRERETKLDRKRREGERGTKLEDSK